MNIYELEKQATPGPLQSWTCESTDDSTIGLTPANPPQEWCAYVEGYRHKEAAALLAHCRNNFMKALEALKKTYGLANLWEGDDTEREWAAEVEILIKELEEVK